jgi:hypothetical protein
MFFFISVQYQQYHIILVYQVQGSLLWSAVSSIIKSIKSTSNKIINLVIVVDSLPSLQGDWVSGTKELNYVVCDEEKKIVLYEPIKEGTPSICTF